MRRVKTWLVALFVVGAVTILGDELDQVFTAIGSAIGPWVP
jgi:Flp pilus assembly pilin Flp